MATQPNQVLSEALALPPIERAALVEQILASFDFPARQKLDAAWAAEAEDRIAAYERGEIKATPADEVFAKIDKRHSK